MQHVTVNVSLFRNVVEVSHEDNKEPSGSKNDGEFLDKLNNCLLLKNKSVPRSSLRHVKHRRNCSVKIYFKSLWRWYVNTIIAFLDIIRRPVFHLTQNVSETILSPSSGKILLSWAQTIDIVPISGH
jgi:hypothetical protein